MTLFAHRQLPPTTREAAAARASRDRLTAHLRDESPLVVKVEGVEPNETIELPSAAVSLLIDILDAMAAGRSVTLVPDEQELSTFEAAELLHVSRPFLIKLLEEGAIPHRKVGKHRRIRAEDVMAYKARDDREREAALDRLVAEAQQEDMGYGRI